LVLLLPLAAYGSTTLTRHRRTNINQRPLFQGITYSRQVTDQSFPQVVHILDIDLTTPGLRPLVTAGAEAATPNANRLDVYETTAQRTSEFLNTHQLQIAINANYFYPFQEVTPWNYGPRSGETVNMVGVAIANGQSVSLPESDWPALCFLAQRAVIEPDGSCPGGTTQAVSGDAMLLQNGEPREALARVLEGRSPNDKAYPMNIVALDETGNRLWLILSDGKQPLYSEGTRLEDIYLILRDLGATTAMRLDGGGSTTLAVATENGPALLNAAIHAKIPGFERPVANNLGFYAPALEP
ncbi:MAG: phosphodiester glycosidase family protein, partial [Cyanobacteria bacterium J06632_22]